ncbi:MAG TPA: hypothetical protein VGL56_15855 [Fimbriimonadaceae bacterium]
MATTPQSGAGIDTTTKSSGLDVLAFDGTVMSSGPWATLSRAGIRNGTWNLTF